MKKGRFVRNLLLATLVPAVVAAILYFCISLYYKDRFYNGTWINGVNFSNKTVSEVKESLKEYKADYVFRISDAKGRQETLTGAQIDYTVTYDHVVDEIKQEQGCFLWLMALAGVHFYTVENEASYDDSKLTEAVHQLQCISGEDVALPENAYVEFTDEGVVLVPEKAGTKIDESRLLQDVKTVLEAGGTRLTMDDSYYIQPEITVDSEEIRKVMEPVEKIENTVVTYTFGESEEVLDKEITKSWVMKDEEGEITVNQEKAAAYVQSLAEKYNTYGGSREFKTSKGKTVTVKGGNYGWRINVSDETEALVQILKDGESQSREPIYSDTAARRGGNEIGNTYIEISIKDQHMWYYKDGSLYMETGVVTGKTSEGYDTPTGSFKVLNRHVDITLKGEEKDGTEYSSDVDYWLGFWGRGYGIHDSSWRGESQDSYGGTIYKYGGSHGCVNTPAPMMKKLYDAVAVNTPVMIY